MNQEKINELNREEQQEAREEPMRDWIQYNILYLQEEFAEQNQDKFDEFCQEEYHQLED